MCNKALDELGRHSERYIPLCDIVRKVHELWPTENVNEGTIRDQVFRHRINCHPTLTNFPTVAKCGNGGSFLSSTAKEIIASIIKTEIKQFMIWR
jgi:hypothetical protein